MRPTSAARWSIFDPLAARPTRSRAGLGDVCRACRFLHHARQALASQVSVEPLSGPPSSPPQGLRAARRLVVLVAVGYLGLGLAQGAVHFGVVGLGVVGCPRVVQTVVLAICGRRWCVRRDSKQWRHGTVRCNNG